MIKKIALALLLSSSLAAQGFAQTVETLGAGNSNGTITPFTANDLVGVNSSGGLVDTSQLSSPAVAANGVGFSGSASIIGGEIAKLGTQTGGSGYTSGTALFGINTLVGGTGYTAGQYNGVAITDSTTPAATGATANVTVSPAGIVIGVTIPNNGGNAAGYLVGDSLTVSNALIGGAGTGLTFNVSSTGAVYATAPATGGSGTGATLSCNVNSTGTALSCSLGARGKNYTASDTLSVAAANVGGTGSGYSIPVSAIALAQTAGIWIDTGQVFFNIGNVTPANSALGNSGFQTSEGVTGTCSSNCYVNTLNIGFDNAADGSGTSGSYINGVGWLFNQNIGGATMTGNRVVVDAALLLNSTTGNTAANASYTAIGASLTATVPDNGTSASSTATARNQLEVENLVLTMGPNAQNYFAAQGAEFDIHMQTGSSAWAKTALEIVEFPDDKVAGSAFDAAIWLSNNTGAVGWTNGLLFGANSAASWPFQSGAVAITCSSCGTLASVMDFSAATITGNFLKGPGFQVTGAGAVSGLTFDPTQTTCAASSTYIYATNSGSISFCNNGTAVSNWSNGGANVFVSQATANLGAIFRNTTNNSAASMSIYLGNNTSQTESSLTVNSSAVVSGHGANALTLTSGGPFFITGGSTDGYEIDAAGINYLLVAASDSGATDATVCRRTSNGQLLAGSGTIGICLGTSSARYKHDISDLDVGLNEIERLRPKRYYLNPDHGDSTKPFYGFLAEDGADVLPTLVGDDSGGKPNTFDYLGIVPVLVKAMQEQQVEIDALRGRLH